MKKFFGIIILIIIICFSIDFDKNQIFERKDASFSAPVTINNHMNSNTIYGKINKNNDIDFIKFKGKKYENFYIELRIPNLTGEKGFSPEIVLISKEIVQKDAIPFDLPKGYGALVIKSTDNKSKYFDSFTGSYYHLAQSLRGEIPENGEYYVAVYNEKSNGKYVLDLGERKKFSISDFLKVPYLYFKVKFFFSPIKLISIIALIIIAFVSIMYIFKKRESIIRALKIKIYRRKV
ncbi:hypothetical protein [Clostridium cylindrosporum]|uniref:Uncharacterized protein n=1 Tax=Clostridium cylindrosporum DSM 605 TaxID=1121307 RepID=A0A0J8G0D3_CLOCY|nr:hypothetical protein [Clostridium cylindrosporum]KMT21246.1 hypothetical protein CLCY_2c00060 [Clostridium cylindrosporum DSM 605]